jgi:hypothetical protein
LENNFREVWHSDYSQGCGFAVYSSGTILGHGGLRMGARFSRSRGLALASVVAALVIAVAGTDQAQARAKSKREARPRAIHGLNYTRPMLTSSSTTSPASCCTR